MGADNCECTGAIEPAEYDATVLGLSHGDSEDAFDQRLALEARRMGVDPSPMLKSSDSITIQSRPSNSTDPTSCASSERRRKVPSPHSPKNSPNHSTSPSVLSFDEKRSSRQGLRASLKKMATFRKRKSEDGKTCTVLARIDSNLVSGLKPLGSLQSGAISPLSVKSYSSSSSSPVPTMNDQTGEDDDSSLKRSMDAPEMQFLREQHLQERARFLAYQRQALSQLREQHKLSKKRLHDTHEEEASETEEKNAAAADDLESRQLEAEAKFRQDLESEKRACLIRLRHMEAYCHTPSPPVTPQCEESSSQEYPRHSLPERKVTDKDYAFLAAQYRERDTMDSLHKAKLEVMHGRQEKVFNSFVKRKEKELATLIATQEKAEAKFTLKCDKEEDRFNGLLEDKRQRMQARWKLQTLIQCSKLQQNSGMHYAALPELGFEADDSLAI